MTSDIEDKCSVCLKTGTNYNIFTTYNISEDKEELYVDVMKKCFNIEITQDSGLNAMCTDCIIKLGTAYNFKNDITEAVQRLAAFQGIVTTDANADENQSSQEEHLYNQFDNDYNINTVLNPETGQISYTLDKINEVKDTKGNEPDSYIIDMENDVIISSKEANKKTIKKKRKLDADVVKENIPGNIEKETKIRQRKRARKDVKKKDSVEIVDKNVPDVVEETKDDINDARKSCSKEDLPERTENVISVHIRDNIFINIKPQKPSNANKPPPFTLEPGQLDCKLCGDSFDTTKALSTHMNVHYPDYVCVDCGMAFASERRMRMHRSQTHVEGPYVCKHCDKEYTNVNSRNAHMWRVHTKTDPYKCQQCDERFKTYLKRLRHVQSAHGNAVEYPCQYCDKKFAYAAYRTKHVRTVHLQVRPHKCPMCPFSFARRRELDAHRATKHGDGEMKYQCDICSKKFYLKTALKFHVNLHINRYSCNECDAKFPKICQLETHRQSHEGLGGPLDEPALEGLQLDELSDYSFDCSYWGLGEI